ncbi:MAG: maleylpyruvate isomerase N-terminal domain-containing protein [Actinomycetota bacterium]
MEWDPEAAAAVVHDEGHTLVNRCQQSATRPVPSCPGWTAADLAIHTATVHRRVAHWCTIRATTPEPAPNPQPDDPHTPWDWCHAAVDLVADALTTIAPDEPVWTWTDRQDAGFYHRRMVHETVLHHWDAASIDATPIALDPARSADGIDELMTVGMRFRSGGAAIDYPAGSVSILATDTGHRWSLVAIDRALGIGRGATVITGTDATITATAANLFLALWGRASTALDRRGDIGVAEAWCTVAP